MGHVIVIRREGADASVYEASQDGICAEGPTLGTALDALLNQIGDTTEPLILVRRGASDSFFTQNEYQRLQVLIARHKGEDAPLTSDELQEMEQLIDKEILATARRAEAALQQKAA
ncbi:MAG: hypothetical protein QM758_12845 [Armatimonas sp.]